MAEAEPGAAEEVVELCDEPLESTEARVCLYNVRGTLYRAHR